MNKLEKQIFSMKYGADGYPLNSSLLKKGFKKLRQRLEPFRKSWKFYD